MKNGEADGLWTRVRVEDVATIEAFRRDPEGVLAFHNGLRRGALAPNVKPNAAHADLARLEAEWPGRVLVVTQNIDNLHEQAGSQDVIHMHGDLFTARCDACRRVFEWLEDFTVDLTCGDCGAKGKVRPHVVWFGEMPFDMERIHEALDGCALFMSIGTSGAVYPAAGFVQHVRLGGTGHTVELNLEPSEGASLFAEAHYGPASQVVPEYVERLLSGR